MIKLNKTDPKELFDTSFSGRIIQATESLDRADAVSNQVIELDGIFSDMGFDSVIVSKWHHEDVGRYRRDFEDIQVTDRDIVIFHSCGYTEHAGIWSAQQYCTKILLYHNITPHDFFSRGSKLYKFCKSGREQLKDFIPQFSHYWADSQYNLDELIELGANPDRSIVIPIVVPVPSQKYTLDRIAGQWIFIGRIARNKGQLDLVKMFARAQKKSPGKVKKLILVGGFDPSDDYYREILKEIVNLGLVEKVDITGKVTDAEREEYLKEAQFYVSLSAHEGFGVPLVEAPMRGLTVLALNRAAANETMGGIGLFEDEASLLAGILALASDDTARISLVQKQSLNANRFSRPAVRNRLTSALESILPSRNHYKNVSVVICTYNRLDYLSRCLDYLGYQSNKNFEVVIIDGPSDDGTKKLLEKWKPYIKFAENDQRNLSLSRNMGIEMATGDIVAFIDDDAIPFDNWIDNILVEYNSRTLITQALGGPAFFAGTLRFQSEDIGIDRHARAWVNIPAHEVGQNGWFRSCLGTNSTFVREALVALDGFDEQFDYFLDESEVCLRFQLKGYIIGYAPNVLVRHEFAQSHNRRGRYDYDWKTIAKNTAYYMAVYSGMQGSELRLNLKSRLERERHLPLKVAFENAEISEQVYIDGVKGIADGLEQGLKDAAAWPKTRKLAAIGSTFLPFPLCRDYKAVGRDLPLLHICIVTKEMPPFVPGGGIGTLYYHLASELLLMGYQVSIVVPGIEATVLRQGPLTVYYTQSQWVDISGMDAGLNSNLTWSVSALGRIAQIHRDNRIDVIDSALWDSEALAISSIGRLDRPPLVVRLVTPFQVVADMNGWKVPTRVSELFNAFEKRLIGNADAIIPISNQIAATVSAGHAIEIDPRWRTGHCGIAYWPLFDVNEDYNDFPELEGLQPAQLEYSKIVLFVGRLEKRKGIDLIADALPRILAKDKDARVVIAGSDPENWQQRISSSLSPADIQRVHFLGVISDALKEKLLARAYCLIFPSRYESFGLVPLEAFVHGVPVVASRSGAIPEVVLDGECGLLFNEDDSEHLVAAVGTLLSDPKLHHKLSTGALKRVRELSARKSAQHTLMVYNELLSQPHIEKHNERQSSRAL
jgi:glycosyltransferase involved in cell wall biosynthesis